MGSNLGLGYMGSNLGLGDMGSNLGLGDMGSNLGQLLCCSLAFISARVLFTERSLK